MKAKTKPIPFSVALSLDTGCIVMLKSGKVAGSLNRSQSLMFAKSVEDWTPDKPKETEAPRAVYPH